MRSTVPRVSETSMRSNGPAFVRDIIAREDARKSAYLANSKTTRTELSKRENVCTTLRKADVCATVKTENGCTPLKRADGYAALKREDGYTTCAQKSAVGHGIDDLLDGPHRLVTISSSLKRLGKAKNLLDGRRVHHHIIERGYGWENLLGKCLVQMYGNCGLVEDAQSTFDKLSNHDTYSWNILINVYGHNKSLDDARNVFNMMPFRDVVSWNAILTLLTLNGHGKQALDLFHQMQLQGIMPSDVTFISVMDACSTLAVLEKGKQIHAMITGAGYEDNVVVGTALINMYGKCGCLCNARSVFGTLPHQDVVSWTAMIGCLTQNGCNVEALDYFHKMQSEGMSPNNITFICAMEACANLAALEEGQQIHTSIVMICYEHEIKVSNALIDMYSKCGSLVFAMSLFRRMRHRTIVSWNAMITVFGQHGLGKEAMALFWQMQTEGVKPDNITFISIMNACSHMGLVEDGWCFFFTMCRDHKLVHMIDHYVCMIDLLGRAGRLDEAETVVINIPFENTVVAWLCLLAGCRTHGDVERGSCAANRCFKLDPGHGAPYIVLSNLYTGLFFSDLKDL